MSTADQPAAQQPVKQKGWFGRNWLWFVPTIILLPILACGGCGLGGFFWIVSNLKGEPYQQALSYLQNSETVTDRLGEPVEEASPIPSGSVVDTPGGEANLLFDVSGPNGKAHVQLRSRKFDNRWEMVILKVTFPDGEEVDLLATERDIAPDNLESAPPFNPGGANESTDANTADEPEN